MYCQSCVLIEGDYYVVSCRSHLYLVTPISHNGNEWSVDFLKTFSVCVPVPEEEGTCTIDQVLMGKGNYPYFWQHSSAGLTRVELRKESGSQLRLVCSGVVKVPVLDTGPKPSWFPGKSCCLIGGSQPFFVDAESATCKPLVLPGCVVDAVEVQEHWYVLMKIGTGGLLVQRISGDTAVSVRQSVECPETPKQLLVSSSLEGTTLWLLTDSSIRALELDVDGKKLSLGPNLLQTGDQLQAFRYGCTRFKKSTVILPPYFALLGDGTGRLLNPKAEDGSSDDRTDFDGSTFRVIQRSTTIVALSSNVWCSLGEDRSITLLERVVPNGTLRITESFSDSDGAISGVVAVCRATPSFFGFMNDEGNRLFIMEKTCALCESYQEVMEGDDILSEGSKIIVNHGGDCYLLGECEAIQLPLSSEKLLATSSSRINTSSLYFVTSTCISELNSPEGTPRYHRTSHPILAAAFSPGDRDVLAYISDAKVWILDGGEGPLEFGKERVVTTLTAQVRTLCFSVNFSVLLILWGGEAIRVSSTGTVTPIQNEQTVPCAVASSPIPGACVLDVIGTTEGSLLLFIDDTFKEKVQVSMQPIKQLAIDANASTVFALSASSLHLAKFSPTPGHYTEIKRVLSVSPSSIALTKQSLYLVLDGTVGFAPLQHFTECNPLPLVSKELEGFSSAVRYPRSDLVVWLQTHNAPSDCDTIATLNPFCPASAAFYRSPSAGYLDLQCVRVRDKRSCKDFVVGIGRQINVFFVNPCGKLKQVSSIVCKVNSFPVWTVGIEFKNTVIVMNQRYIGVLDFQSPHKLSRLFEYCADETVSSLVVSARVNPDDDLSLLVTYDNSTESSVSLLPILDVFAA